MHITIEHTLNSKQKEDAEQLINRCQAYDHTYRQPYLSSQFNFDPEMPAFFLAYNEERLMGLLTIYAEDYDAEICLLTDPNFRRQGIAKQLLDSFKATIRPYPIQHYYFQTEQIFLDNHSDFLQQTSLNVSNEKEFWLGHERTPYQFEIKSDFTFERAKPSDASEIASMQAKAFRNEIEISQRYAQEAIKDPTNYLYILRNQSKIVGSCTIDTGNNLNYIYGLAIDEAYRRQGLASYLIKSAINELISINTADFQIAVDDINLPARQLYEKLGFTYQTTVIYLDYWK